MLASREVFHIVLLKDLHSHCNTEHRMLQSFLLSTSDPSPTPKMNCVMYVKAELMS